jgi:hypothetical protein
LIQRPGWEILFGSGSELLLHCPSKFQALSILRYQSLLSQLAIDAAALGYHRMVLRYPVPGDEPFCYIPLVASKKPLILPKDKDLHMTSTFQQAIDPEIRKNVWVSDELEVDDPLLRSIAQIIESPWPAGLTRIRDYRQMVVNKRFSLILPDRPQESVKKKTNTFIIPADLEQVELMTRLHGSPGSTFEVSYRAALDDQRLCWARFVNRYRVTVDNAGAVFRWAEVIDLDLLRGVPIDVQESRQR